MTSAAIKTKLNGEIAMKTFGVELFDLILKSDQTNEATTMPAVFSSI